MKGNFTLLYATHYEEMCRYVRARIVVVDDTEDIVQETFLLAWERYDQLQNHPNQLGWLKLVAKNKIREYMRNFRPALSLIGKEQETVREETDYCWKEMELLMHQIFTEAECVCFERYYLKGISGREMARLEQTTEGNIRVKMSRIRKKMIGQLKENA